MRTALTIQCEYSEGEQILEELLLASFCSFLKKELCAVAVGRNVSYVETGKQPRISGGDRCIMR